MYHEHQYLLRVVRNYVPHGREDSIYRLVHERSCKEDGDCEVPANSEHGSYVNFSHAYVEQYNADNFHLFICYNSQLRFFTDAD